jgi:DNA-binding beta-propeller fold protein YncE
VIHLAAADDGVWATDDCGCPTGRLLRIDLTLGRVTASYRVGQTPVAVAVGGGAVWVANFNDSTVSRVPLRPS